MKSQNYNIILSRASLQKRAHEAWAWPAGYYLLYPFFPDTWKKRCKENTFWSFPGRQNACKSLSETQVIALLQSNWTTVWVFSGVIHTSKYWPELYFMAAHFTPSRDTCFWLGINPFRNERYRISYGKKVLKATKSYTTLRSRGFSKHQISSAALDFRSRITEINSFLPIWFTGVIQVFWRHHISTSVMLGRSQVKIVKDFNTELSLSCATRSRNCFRFKNETG